MWFVAPHARRVIPFVWLAGSLLSGCNNPVVNPGPTQPAPQTGPQPGPQFPADAAGIPESAPQDVLQLRNGNENVRYHQVKAGETLSGIAQQYGVTTEGLVQANGLGAPDQMQPGQWIAIPGP